MKAPYRIKFVTYFLERATKISCRFVHTLLTYVCVSRNISPSLYLCSKYAEYAVPKHIESAWVDWVTLGLDDKQIYGTNQYQQYKANEFHGTWNLQQRTVVPEKEALLCARSTMIRLKLKCVRTVFVTPCVIFQFECFCSVRKVLRIVLYHMACWAPARSDIFCDKGWSRLTSWILSSCTFGTSGFVPGPCHAPRRSLVHRP